MPTEAERLEHIAARLASLFNGERLAHEANPACMTIYNDFLKEIGREAITKGGPDIDALLMEMNLTDQQYITDNPGTQFTMPSADFYYWVGFLAYANQTSIRDSIDLQMPLLEMISEKTLRAKIDPVQFSWCVLLLEKLIYAMDREATSNAFLECTDELLNAVYFYLYERTDLKPPQMVMDCALRLMRSASNIGTYRPKFWPAHLRIFVTRCLRTREVPFEIQEMCYKLTCQAAWQQGPRFWSNDEQFVRVLAAMCAIHWRLMLEGLADREPLVSAYSLFLEIFLVCEERNRISDQTAICVAANCKEILEAVAGYIKGEDQNPEALREGQRYIVTALMSTLVSTGAFQMVHEDDERAIVDWWLKHSMEQSDVFRQLMLCSTHVKQLDTRVMGALAAYYERCVTGDVPEDEADMMVLHWVVKLIQDNRTDFFDKASLSDCVARLERVRTPKKYLDALKKLKC